MTRSGISSRRPGADWPMAERVRWSANSAGRQLQCQGAQHPVPVGSRQVQVTGVLQIEQDQVALLVPPEGGQRRVGGFDVVGLLLGQEFAPAGRAGPPLQRVGGGGEGRHGRGRFGQVQHDFARADHRAGQRRQLPAGGREVDCRGAQGPVEHGGVQGCLGRAQVLLGGRGPVFGQGDAAAAVPAALLQDAAGGHRGQQRGRQDPAPDRGDLTGAGLRRVRWAGGLLRRGTCFGGGVRGSGLSGRGRRGLARAAPPCALCRPPVFSSEASGVWGAGWAPRRPAPCCWCS